MDHHFGQRAPDAAQDGVNETIPAFPSQTTDVASFGIAGIATSQGALSSTVLSKGEIWARDVRGLCKATLDRLPVAFATEAFFPDLQRKTGAIVFKYAEGWKARATSEKAFVAGKGFKLSFWNLAAVLDGLASGKTDLIYVVEGEIDACSLVEAGVSHQAVLSVPNGAKQHSSDNPQAQNGYSFVTDALQAGLAKAKGFVWCGDMDGPGLALRSDMVALFGEARFRFVEWPDDRKDANQVLLEDGPDHLLDLVMEAKPWPVAGLYRMSELPEPPPLTLWDAGFPEWEGKIKLAPRTLSVATGHPGHGKTQCWSQIWFQIAKVYGIGICVASFETRPKPHLRKTLRSLYHGALERNLTVDEIKSADEWIEAHYLFLSHPQQRPDLDWLLRMAEVAVIRHGARVIQIDPWNRLESARADRESETDYIGRCLRALHGFAHDMNCHVQILAHPSKMDAARRGQAPGLEDISGSKNWENAVDQGFVVHRPVVFENGERKTDAHFYCRKSRFEELGFPCKMILDFDIKTGRYRSADYDAPVAKTSKKKA